MARPAKDWRSRLTSGVRSPDPLVQHLGHQVRGQVGRPRSQVAQPRAQLTRPPTRLPDYQNSSFGFWSPFPFFFGPVEWMKLGFRRFKVKKGNPLPHTSHSHLIPSRTQPWHHLLHAPMAKLSSPSPQTPPPRTPQHPRTHHVLSNPSHGRRVPRDPSGGHPGRWD